MSKSEINPKSEIRKGFTLVELILTVTIFAIIFGSTAIVFGNLLGQRRLANEGYKIVQLLREARTNAVTGLQGSPWGMYFGPPSNPNQYILFKGDTYETRDPAFDLEILLPASVTFSVINFGGGNEADFHSQTGITNEGTLTLVSGSDEFTITLNRLGLADYAY